MANKKEKEKQLFTQFIIGRTSMGAADILVWGFYYIFLYKLTNSLQDVLIERLYLYIGLWIGFIIGSFTLNKLGYSINYKISFFIQALVLILMIVFMGSIDRLYGVFAIIRGMGRGMFWPTNNAYKLKEVRGAKRGEVINIIQSILLLLGIILPAMAGGVIQASGYELLFLIGAAVYILAAIKPYSYSKKLRSKIRSSEIKRILDRPGFDKFAILNLVDDAAKMLMALLFVIVPYILFGNEFSVGIFVSVIGFAAAVSSFLERKTSLKNRIKLGYFGYLIYVTLTGLLSIFWTIPMLAIRSLGITFTTAFGTTAFDDVSYRIREKILGDFKNESVIEMNIAMETIFLIARILVHSILIIFLNSTLSQTDSVIRVLIFVASAVIAVTYWVEIQLNKAIKVH